MDRPAPLAGAVELPREFNAATWFVDRHVADGRAARLAIRYDGRDISYGDVAAGANRCGNALRGLGVHMEQRVVLLLPDSPDLVHAFWGAIKIGAVPVPTNPGLKPRDYEYILNDSRAEVAVAGADLAPAIEELRPRLRFLKHLVVAGPAGTGGAHAPPGPGQLGLAELVADAAPELDPAPTTRDDVAFWLYTSRPRSHHARRRRLLAVHVGHDGHAQGGRAPAPRHGRLLQRIRKARTRDRG